MNCWMRPFIGTVLAILLAGAPEVWAASPDSANPVSGAETIRQETSAAADGQKLPDSPGAVLAQKTGETVPQNDPSAQSPTQTSSQPSATPQQTASQQNGSSNAAPQNVPQQPAGGAAAQLGRTTGGAASKPAGAALAPAKQRQTRSLLLKLGVIAGAGIAVGSVAALSKASPSRPPGAH